MFLSYHEYLRSLSNENLEELQQELEAKLKNAVEFDLWGLASDYSKSLSGIRTIRRLRLK